MDGIGRSPDTVCFRSCASARRPRGHLAQVLGCPCTPKLHGQVQGVIAEPGGPQMAQRYFLQPPQQASLPPGPSLNWHRPPPCPADNILGSEDEQASPFV